MSKAIEIRIAGLITDVVAQAGYDLVRVHLSGNGKYAALQIMAERKDGEGMTVEDCASISVLVGEIIEADPELADRYGLEVSSPGIDRPLVRLEDYKRFAGHVAKIELERPLEGQRRFQGKIVGVTGDEIELNAEKGVVKIPFSSVMRAKLVLTDELLKQARKDQVSQ